MIEEILAYLATLDLGQMAVIVCVAVVASTLGAMSGSGVSLLLIPFVEPVVGIKGVVPLMSVCMLLGNTSRIWVFRKSIDWSAARLVMFGALPGVVIGTTIYEWLPAQALYLMLGGFLLASVLWRRFSPVRSGITVTRRTAPAYGSLFGVVSGTLSGGGVILLAILIGLGLKGAGLVGTKAGFAFFMHIAKTTMFSIHGLIDLQLVIFGLLIGISTVPGAYMARFILERMDLRLHAMIIDIVVVVGAGMMLWRGFAG